MSILGILLDGGSYGASGAAAGFGVATFIIACIALVLAPILLLIALFVYLAGKKGEPKSNSVHVLVKIGLIILVIGGIGLLLTAVLCSWR